MKEEEPVIWVFKLERDQLKTVPSFPGGNHSSFIRRVKSPYSAMEISVNALGTFKLQEVGFHG